MYKAVLFDLDGTIADTVESIAVASNKALEACGLKTLPIEKYKYLAGDGSETLIRRAIFEAGDKEEKLFQKAFATYNVFFEENCTYHVTAFEGIKEMLENMKKNHMKMAVVTNKPHNRGIKVVEKVFGRDYFDFILGQNENMPRKPDPFMALYAAKALGVLPEDCMYVGDTNVDMQTGNAAGMFTVGVLWGFREKEELLANHAHALVSKPLELLELC